jgi:hypothetical protein
LKSNAKTGERIYTLLNRQTGVFRIKVEQAELNRAQSSVPTVPVSKLWRTIRGFILWSYERGTVQYDVMVTLILLFVFFSPRLINFKDRPVDRNPQPTGVVVSPDGQGGLLYQVDAKAIQPGKDDAVRQQLLRVIEPISGEVTISRYQAISDKRGHVTAYKVWVDRQ